MSARVPRWLPAFAAFEALRNQYEASGFYDFEDACGRAASDTLLRRLKAGQLPSRAASYYEEWDWPFDEEVQPPPSPDADGMIPVPQAFWASLAASTPVNREADWLAGDFEFKVIAASGRTGWGQNGEGVALGLEIDINYFPLWDGDKDIQTTQSPSQRSGGRPAANWWPDFAEELAVYIHENGIPAGHGHEGQTVLMDAVFARMAEQGKPEPGRGTVQAVVNAVLRRVRSAGN